MSIRKTAFYLALALTVMMAGCAHWAANPAQAAADKNTPAAEKSVAPGSAAGIVALAKHLTAFPRARYSVVSGKYAYFAGGVLNAEYDTDSSVLILTPLEQNTPAVTCKYSPEGILYIPPDASTGKETFASTCNGLAARLNDILSR